VGLLLQVRFLVNELRKQVDSHVGELASDLEAQPQHASQGSSDDYIFKVDQKLLPPAVCRPLYQDPLAHYNALIFPGCLGISQVVTWPAGRHSQLLLAATH
jgi:hypothetical protein